MSSNPLSKLIARADEAQTWEAVADGLPLEVIEALEWSNDSLGQCIAALRAVLPAYKSLLSQVHGVDALDEIERRCNDTHPLRQVRKALAFIEGGAE